MANFAAVVGAWLMLQLWWEHGCYSCGGSTAMLQQWWEHG